MKKLLTLLAIGFSGVALAQQGEMPSFEEIDTNADGSISRDEARVVEGLDFAEADANQDGSLSREEYAAASSEQ